MKDQKKFEKWAMVYLKKLSKILLLEHFTPIEITLSKKMKNGVLAEFGWSHPYQTISIYYHQDLLEDFKKGKKTSIVGVLAHEMCHALTDPLYEHAIRRYVEKDAVNDEREKLTDHIANIILKADLL